MNIGRKQALVAFAGGIAAMIPFLSRRAGAQEALPLAPSPIEPRPIQPIKPQATEVEELTKRVAALEAALASQVAFSKDAAGNLTLHGPGNITVMAGSNFSLKASGQGTLQSSAAMKITGATINLN